MKKITLTLLLTIDLFSFNARSNNNDLICHQDLIPYIIDLLVDGGMSKKQAIQAVKTEIDREVKDAISRSIVKGVRVAHQYIQL